MRLVGGGWAKVGEARTAFGLPVRPEDDVFLRPLNVVESGGLALSDAKTSPFSGREASGRRTSPLRFFSPRAQIIARAPRP